MSYIDYSTQSPLERISSIITSTLIKWHANDTNQFYDNDDALDNINIKDDEEDKEDKLLIKEFSSINITLNETNGNGNGDGDGGCFKNDDVLIGKGKYKFSLKLFKNLHIYLATNDYRLSRGVNESNEENEKNENNKKIKMRKVIVADKK